MDKKQIALDSAGRNRKPWTAPRIDRIRAGEAEIGTRSAHGDGAYTTS